MATVYPIAGIEASRIGGNSSEMDRVAGIIAAMASAAGIEPVQTRNVAGPRGVRDRVVESLDPLEGPKEFGHVIRNQKDGPVLGYVRGLHRMQGVWRRMPRTGS